MKKYKITANLDQLKEMGITDDFLAREGLFAGTDKNGWIKIKVGEKIISVKPEYLELKEESNNFYKNLLK